MSAHKTSLSTGVTLEYALSGSVGAPVLGFVHGLGANMQQFLPQESHLTGPYRVLRLSLRGHGGSSLPASATPDAFSPRVLARDVQALLRHLDIEALHFVGNSLGGLVGYELLQLGAPRLLSLTTFGTTAELHSSRLTYWIVVASAHLLGVRGTAALVGKTATKFPSVGAELARMYRSATKEAQLRIPGHIYDYDYTPTLRHADVPLLLIRGAQDKGINAALDSTLAALEAAPRARIVPLPDAGHFANMEQPAAFNAILEAFLDEV